MAVRLVNAPIGLFEIDGVLVLKTQYCTKHEDGTVTADCYIVDSGEYFWGGVESAEERNNLMVTPVDMPTLTPPNELMEALEAINNAAVAYIEGGPYENDLPGMELAVEIDRLSRDFVRPPNEALPVLVNDEPDREYIDYICPRCKNTISQRRRGQRMETVYQCKYHDNCGQRVDWSNPQLYRRPPEGEANE